MVLALSAAGVGTNYLALSLKAQLHASERPPQPDARQVSASKAADLLQNPCLAGRQPNWSRHVDLNYLQGVQAARMKCLSLGKNAITSQPWITMPSKDGDYTDTLGLVLAGALLRGGSGN